MIFVPVPHMAEVYGARIAGDVPDDIVIAPYLCKTILELLQQNVEVVDLLPALLKERGADDDALYRLADPHWSDRGKRIAATEVARGLRRYSWSAATDGLPRYTVEEKNSPVQGYFLQLLTDSEKAELGSPVMMRNRVTGGWPVAFVVKEAPVMVIGDSFSDYQLVRRTGFFQQLTQLINQPVTPRAPAGGIFSFSKTWPATWSNSAAPGW